jgi:hypothetical protein
MAATPNVPNIQKAPDSDRPGRSSQKPARIVENAPAPTVEKALANGRRQVDSTK